MHKSDCLSRLCSLNDSPIKSLRNLNPNQGCELKYAKEMVCKAANLLAEHHCDKVQLVKGQVVQIHQLCDALAGSFSKDVWKVVLSPSSSFSSPPHLTAEYLFLATGSQPKELKPQFPLAISHPTTIDLDAALSPSVLRNFINEDDVVAVVGSSHSAVLVLKNLVELPSAPKLIKNFYKSPLKYAVYNENWILYDNTGLKGLAADWARANLAQLPIGKIHRIQMNSDFQEFALEYESLVNCTKIIYAVGYQRTQLPQVFNFQKNTASCISFNNENGRIYLDGMEAPNMYGFGIAFPQRIVDPYGNMEDNVGMFKFMKYIKATLPGALRMHE
jgi:hypothetical protein